MLLWLFLALTLLFQLWDDGVFPSDHGSEEAGDLNMNNPKEDPGLKSPYER